MDRIRQHKAHQARRGRLRQQGLKLGNRLQTLPELLAALADLLQAGLGLAFGLQQLQRAVEAGEQGEAGRGHLKAAGIAVEGAAGGGFVAEAAPADQGGRAVGQQSLRQGHCPQTFGAAAPLVARAGVDVGGGGGLRHPNGAKGLGGIDQQPGLAAMGLEPLGHRGDRHQLAGVPEDVGERHQARPRRQGRLQGRQHTDRRRFGRASQLHDRQDGQLEALPPGQFADAGYDAGVFGVTDQQLITRLPGQPPEGQQAAGGDVLTEGHPGRRHAEPARQPLAQAVRGTGHVGPDVAAERPQLLDRGPGRVDGRQRIVRQRPLAAVIEVGLVGEGRHLPAQGGDHGRACSCRFTLP